MWRELPVVFQLCSTTGFGRFLDVIKQTKGLVIRPSIFMSNSNTCYPLFLLFVPFNTCVSRSVASGNIHSILQVFAPTADPKVASTIIKTVAVDVVDNFRLKNLSIDDTRTNYAMHILKRDFFSSSNGPTNIKRSHCFGRPCVPTQRQQVCIDRINDQRAMLQFFGYWGIIGLHVTSLLRALREAAGRNPAAFIVSEATL